MAIRVETQNEINRQLNKHNSSRSRGGVPSRPGEPPGKATGLLARSWQIGQGAVVDDSGINSPTNPKISLGSNMPYARIHEYGGPIRMRDKMLKIPVSKEAKRSEAQGASLFASKGRDRLFLFKSKTGKLLLASRSPRGKLTVHYVLKEQVIMPRRPYVAPASLIVGRKAGEIMDKQLSRNLRGVK